MAVVIETTVGDLTVDLFTEERPIACLNFLKLCKLKYYNYNLFHTIEQGFIAQTGDPTGAGDGGSSVWGLVEGPHKRFFEAEYLPKIYHSSAGLLSLVSAGKNMVGSQFFFTLNADLTSLDGLHCVIGQVVEGHETLRKLNEAIVDENFRPYQDIRITHTVVLDDPFPDPRAFRVPSRSPSPSAERLKNGRIAADEDIDDTDGKTMEEIQEMLAEREAKARATILEIVGDLPDADMAPPENVLFVCKLNPVTTDDDLEIIFSRFGKIKSCEVIRDSKTGDSLQYAFVEFEDQKACEAAYFKMDNVLIDDRRIHVDFSQSVSKVKWRGKGRGIDGQKGRLDFNNLKDDGRSHRTDNRRGNNRDGVVRSKISDEERRRVREERHQSQRAREARVRSRSRSRSQNRRNRNGSNYRSRDNGHKERSERDRSPPSRREKRSRSRSKEHRKNFSKNHSSSPEVHKTSGQYKSRYQKSEKRPERSRDTNREEERDRRRSPLADSYGRKSKLDHRNYMDSHRKTRDNGTDHRGNNERRLIKRDQTNHFRSRRSVSAENNRNRSMERKAIRRNSKERRSSMNTKQKRDSAQTKKFDDSKRQIENSDHKRSKNSKDKNNVSRRRSRDVNECRTAKKNQKVIRKESSSSSDSSSDSDVSSLSSSSSTSSSSSSTSSISSDTRNKKVSRR